MSLELDDGLELDGLVALEPLEDGLDVDGLVALLDPEELLDGEVELGELLLDPAPMELEPLDEDGEVLDGELLVVPLPLAPVLEFGVRLQP